MAFERQSAVRSEYGEGRIPFYWNIPGEVMVKNKEKGNRLANVLIPISSALSEPAVSERSCERCDLNPIYCSLLGTLYPPLTYPAMYTHFHGRNARFFCSQHLLHSNLTCQISFRARWRQVDKIRSDVMRSSFVHPFTILNCSPLNVER